MVDVRWKASRLRREPRQRINAAAHGTTTTRGVYHCGCVHVLPWEDCEHTDAEAERIALSMLGLDTNRMEAPNPN